MAQLPTIAELIRDYGPVAIAAFALIISALSFFSARRNERRTIEKSKPLIEATMTPLTNQPGWYSVYFTVENRADIGYRGNYIKITNPWLARALYGAEAHIGNEDKPWVGSPLKRPLPLKIAHRHIPLNFRIEKSGIQSHGPFPGSKHWDTIYVHMPLLRSHSFSMRLSLFSREATEREIILTLRRTIPKTPKNNND